MGRNRKNSLRTRPAVLQMIYFWRLANKKGYQDLKNLTPIESTAEIIMAVSGQGCVDTAGLACVSS
jgi:hypothetical protein